MDYLQPLLSGLHQLHELTLSSSSGRRHGRRKNDDDDDKPTTTTGVVCQSPSRSSRSRRVITILRRRLDGPRIGRDCAVLPPPARPPPPSAAAASFFCCRRQQHYECRGDRQWPARTGAGLPPAPGTARAGFRRGGSHERAARGRRTAAGPARVRPSGGCTGCGGGGGGCCDDDDECGW